MKSEAVSEQIQTIAAENADRAGFDQHCFGANCSKER
jgi:hypothetical protein